MYADDLLLMSSSVLELQKVLDLCSSEGSFLGIHFNYKKSNCLVIGPKYDIIVSTLLLSGMLLLWVKQIKYLGIYVIGGKYYKVYTITMRRNFFASVNGILSKCPRASDITKLCVKRIVYLLLRMPLKV